MSRLLFLIHGMWATPNAWRHWRGYFEERGWHVVAPPLRHHENAPLEPAAGLGTTSLLDYAADLETRLRHLPAPPVIIGHGMGGLLAQILAARGLAAASVLLCPTPPAALGLRRPSAWRPLIRSQMRWGWWRSAHRPAFATAMHGFFNTYSDKLEAGREFARLVHDSGRALFEIAYPFLDKAGRAAHVDPGDITTPMLVIGAGRDRFLPPVIARVVARRYAHVAVHHEFPNQGHWVLGQPGWTDVAGMVEDWIGRAVNPPEVELSDLDRRRAWRASMLRR